MSNTWILQLHALEHRGGLHAIHVMKDVLGVGTEGALSIALPVSPAAAVGEFKRQNEATQLFDRDFDFRAIVRTFAGYLLNDAGQLGWNVEQARLLNRASFLLWTLVDMESAGTFVSEQERRQRAEEYAELSSLHPTEAHLEAHAGFFAELGARDLSSLAISRGLLRGVIRRTFPRNDWDAVEGISMPRVAVPLLAARRLRSGTPRRR